MTDRPNTQEETAAVPATTVDAQPEQIKEVFHELLGVKNRFRKLRSFFGTRQSIKSGEYLFDNTADELKSRGLMGPLTFNIYSSTLAGTLALIVTKAAGLVLPPLPDPTAKLIPGNAMSAQYLKIYPVVASYLQPFMVPIVFLLMAYFISWGTIRGREPAAASIASESIDWSRPSRTRGSNAFLYFDGAYGFIPQAVLAVVFVLLQRIFAASKSPGLTSAGPVQFDVDYTFMVIVLPILSVLGLTIIYSGYLTYYKFPRLLFTAHGYYRPDRTTKPPWGKYILTAMVIVPIITTLASLLFVGVVIVVSRFLAVVITMANGTFAT